MGTELAGLGPPVDQNQSQSFRIAQQPGKPKAEEVGSFERLSVERRSVTRLWRNRVDVFALYAPTLLRPERLFRQTRIEFLDQFCFVLAGELAGKETVQGFVEKTLP